jgi:hypothetical protein
VVSDEAFAELAERLGALEARLPEAAPGMTRVGNRLMPDREFDEPQLLGFELPSGLIVAWDSEEDPPDGWTRCDGGYDSKGNATPDLRGRFLVGVDADQEDDPDCSEAGKTGGLWDHEHTVYNWTDLRGDDLPDSAAGVVVSVTKCTSGMEYDSGSGCCDADLDGAVPWYAVHWIRKD